MMLNVFEDCILNSIASEHELNELENKVMERMENISKGAEISVKKCAGSLYDESDRWGSSLKICDYLCEESTKNPTNYEIQIEYVQKIANLSMLVDLEGFLKDEPQRYQKLYDDGIRKGIQIIRYCNNHKLIDKAHYALAWIYIHMKDVIAENSKILFNVLCKHLILLPIQKMDCQKKLLTK